MSRLVVELAEKWLDKLVERAGAGLPDFASLEEAAAGLPDPQLAAVLNNFGNPPSSRLVRNRTVTQQVTRSRHFRQRRTSGEPGFAAFFMIDAGALAPADQQRLADDLEALDDSVASVAFEPKYRGARDPDPIYRPAQRYLDAVRWDSRLIHKTSYGLGFATLDVGWNLHHEALAHLGQSPPPLFPQDLPYIPDDDHGTAVLAIIVGRGKVQGMASHATPKALLFPWDDQSIAQTMMDFLEDESADHMQFGDILLIEVEQDSGPGDGLPLEVTPAAFRAIQLAVGQGIAVIEVAGNGHDLGAGRVGWDLDDVSTRPKLAPAWRSRQKQARRQAAPEDVRPRSGIPDSGAIIVSGCSPDPVNGAYCAIPKYNRGSAIDCYGWGTGVLTAGFDAPPAGYNVPPANGDPNLGYDQAFRGTSAAAAMVTGVALVVQQMAHEIWGCALSPAQLRAVLRDVDSGTEVRCNAFPAGILPDLSKIRQQLLLLPKIILRAFVGDDDGVRRTVPADPQSPDIVYSHAHGPDPIDQPIVRGSPGFLYVHARNGGDSRAAVRAMAYWSARDADPTQPVTWTELEVSAPMVVSHGGQPTWMDPIGLEVPLGFFSPTGQIDVVVGVGGELDPVPLIPPMRQSRRRGWSRNEVVDFLHNHVSVAMRSLQVL